MGTLGYIGPVWPAQSHFGVGGRQEQGGGPAERDREKAILWVEQPGG